MPQPAFDSSKFINASQIGGIDAYTIDEGPARGVRVLCINTGGGLRYRVLVDRGLDIDQAFFNQHSLTFLSHRGVTPPTRALDRGLDWLKGFPVGLLTSCGPFNTGGPATDAGEQVGLHGPHSNSAATLESVIQPDPRAGRMEMSVTASFRHGSFYGPCVELRRTIRSTLGENAIAVTDEFFNAGNETVPHAWLLHVNFGYPLVDAGAEFCYDAMQVDPTDNDASRTHFRDGVDYKRIPGPLEAHHGSNSTVAYLYPKPRDAAGNTTVALVNPKLSLAAAIHYNTHEFPRCGNWQHWGRYEYVAALEPMNGGVEGRDKDRALGWLGELAPGERKRYAYEIHIVADAPGIAALRALNGTAK
jgi:hypothetical protein